MTTPETRPGTTTATTTESRMSAGTRSTLIGAIFLMATSAIGPGFITQTTAFTVDLGAAFALAILVSILVDIALQMNVWRVIGVSGLRAQELGNQVLPGLGFVMAALLLLGGFVFNVGNVAGAGLGLDAMLGLDARLGGADHLALEHPPSGGHQGLGGGAGMLLHGHHQLRRQGRRGDGQARGRFLVLRGVDAPGEGVEPSHQAARSGLAG